MNYRHYEDSGGFESGILEMFSSSNRKITPHALEHRIHCRFSITRKQSRRIIHELVKKETLSYTNEYGCTFIEPSILKPVRMSKRVIVKPPERTYVLNNGEVVINLMTGAAFGTGRHPSTRLAVRAIDRIACALRTSFQYPTCLDVGTGSGILILAAAKLTGCNGLGIDIDPNAVAEARHNIELNHLTGALDVREKTAECLDTRFCLIAANLRFTGIIQLAPLLPAISWPGSFLVFSGIKCKEMADIVSVYRPERFERIFLEDEKGWAAVGFKMTGIREN
ncbi:MAG: 50S ribosomal protein L11 methyltransferase [Desulfobacterales bacterium]